MTLANGRPYLAIPGPSVMPDRVLRAMHRAAPNIYEGEVIGMMPGITGGLKALARTRHEVAIYICNGHGAWEAATTNVFSRGDRALALATGRFTHGWAEVARRLGVTVETIDFGKRDPIDLDAVAAALAADPRHEIKAVMCVHVDTSTSVKNDIAGLRQVLDAAGHPALLMVDCIASFACDPFEMDAWGVDVMLTACQKGLMTPPGMGFVYFNERAEAARGGADCVTPYWDWRPRARATELWQYFYGTAPTHHLFGLREALAMIEEEGLENVWARHATLARAAWAALDAWGAGGPVELNVTDPARRSHAVTSVRIGAPHGTRLRRWTEHQAGVTLGIGLGMSEPDDPDGDGFFRLAHMGHVNAHMMLGALGTIEAGLTAIGVPHGRGAIDAAAAVIAGG